ncbi:hypothetical protein ABZX98_19275 [Streptomyces sp. NPDC002992]|uniref:hypothetical protein n=1 Tax=Streptomyces sp. NPDC002992 TaxID=3154273 RepID=UPI0033B48082
MTVTELRPEGETYAEGLARAEKASAEAEALRIKNEGERRRQELAAQKAEARAQKEIQKELEDAEDERREREEQRRTAAAAKVKAAKSAAEWKRGAKAIAVVCIVVSLPLQVMAFWDPKAWFLVAAPLVLEGVAWVLLKGAEAAIDEGRPSWHYRLGALLQALIAAGINFAHGSETYGIATGIGGALCSVIGPAIWDLHEHGRIAKRDGRKTLAQRRAERRTAKAEKARTAKVNQMREQSDKDVWERALYLAAALGELIPTEKTYRRAWDEIHGAEVGATASTISAKRLARRSVRLAQNGPLDGLEKGENPQVDSQMTPADGKPSKAPSEPGEDGRKKNGGTPPVRRPGTTQYAPIARRQMSLEKLRPAQD